MILTTPGGNEIDIRVLNDKDQTRIALHKLKYHRIEFMPFSKELSHIGIYRCMTCATSLTKLVIK